MSLFSKINLYNNSYLNLTMQVSTYIRKPLYTNQYRIISRTGKVFPEK